MNATRITREGLSRLMARRPELVFSISPLVDPAQPQGFTLYSWHVEGETARVYGYYALRSYLPREVARERVEAQLRAAGRRFDVAAWERDRLSRLRGPVAA